MGRVMSILAALVVLAPPAVGATPILVNGSFELAAPDMPGSGELLAGSTALIGWQIAGTSSANNVIDWLGPGGGGPQWLASEGTHLVDLDGRNALGGSVFQSFAATPGQRYLLSFDLSGNPGDAPSNGLPRIKQIRVTVGDLSQDYAFDSTGLTTTTLRWDHIAAGFLASNAVETVSFRSLTPFENSYGALIDNITIEAVPVPEPGTLMLLSTAGWPVWWFRRRGEPDPDWRAEGVGT